MDEEVDDPRPSRFRPLPSVRRELDAFGEVALAISAVFLLLWAVLHGLLDVLSPLFWVALASFWAGAFWLVYAREVGAIERAFASAPSLELLGLRIHWLRAPRGGGFGAAMEVLARSRDERYPVEFRLFLNVGLFWNLYVVGVRCSWSCKESGVLFLEPKRSRFLGGESAESLSLPSQEEAALRGLLRRPDEADTPAWGAPAGAFALEALRYVAAEAWLFGPEQPFVALEARDHQIEKYWSPVAARLADLDVHSALDLLLVVRAFDRDAIASRVGAPISSPSGARPPSSPPT